MRFVPITALLVVAILFSFADADSHPGWDIDDARLAKKIEMQVDKNGRIQEIEFHTDPSVVPEAVRAAMRKLHPEGSFTGAEIERQDGVLYYELTSTTDGLDSESMFLPDGTLHSEENEVRADAVPQAVKDAVMSTFANCQVTAWEEIKDGDRALVEYHVKLEHDGRNVKAMVSTGGAVTGAVLEIPAEIEVPISLR